MRELFRFLFQVETDFQYGFACGILSTILFSSIAVLFITLIDKIETFISEYDDLKDSYKKLEYELKKYKK